VSYGLTYSFPVGEEEQQPLAPPYAAAPGAPLPRPAPLQPAVDALHCYSCLGGPDSSCAAAPASRAAMPLVLRQMLAQMISAANIARIEQVRCMHEAAVECCWSVGHPCGSQRLPAAASRTVLIAGCAAFLALIFRLRASSRF
jgi:hypothetical protein